jgi:uncharacterized protein
VGETIVDQPVTAVVRRRIKAGCERTFELLMQELMAFFLRQPGHLGINVIRLAPNSREFAILDRFATEEDRRRFKELPEYRKWMSRLQDVSEVEPDIQEMGGIAFWFTLPDRQPEIAPPKLRMALLTFLVSYPLGIFYSKLLAPMTDAWPSWLKGVLIAALLVSSLTWVVMPFLTRLFEVWLFHSDEERSQ